MSSKSFLLYPAVSVRSWVFLALPRSAGFIEIGHAQL